MNSWQSGWEANKNKPVVQFLATVVKLEIITVNCGIFKVRIQRQRENSGYSFSKLSWEPLWALCLLDAGGWKPSLTDVCACGRGREHTTLLGHSQWLMYACVYSSNRGLFSKGVDCLHLVHDFWGAVLLNLYKAWSIRWLLQRALLPLILW